MPSAQPSGMASGAATAAPAPDAKPEPKLVHFDPSYADTTLDPCADFHQYVCSKWMKGNPIPPDEAAWDTGSTLVLVNEGILRDVMVQASNPSPQRSAAEQRIGDYWSACMSEEAIEKLGPKALQPDLDRIAALRSKADLPAVIARLHQIAPHDSYMTDNYADQPLFGLFPSQDFADATLMVAMVDQGGMALPGRDMYLKDDADSKAVRQKYEAHVRKMLVLAGEAPDQATNDATAVLAIETTMARAAMENVVRRDPKKIYNVMSLAQLQATTPSFDWKAYFELVGARAPKHYIVTAPAFFQALERLLATEPIGHWQAYLRWWTVHGSSPYLSRAFVDENFDFFARTLAGAQELRPRWRRCVTNADRDLGEALGLAYVARAFSPESKLRADALVAAVKGALGEDIRQMDWMGAQTKKKAAEKLGLIEDKIGYPKIWRDYSKLTIGRDSYLENVRRATAFELARQLDKIGKPVDRTEWAMTPPTVNAYYDAQLNTINFPAGILQPPYFDAKADDAVNYGATGFVMGHEMIHGFDDQGRKFDGKGNLREWWTKTDARRYDQRGKCFVEQYSREIPDLGVKQDGRLSQGEDTADNGGARLGLRALEATLKKQGHSLEDKGADGFTARQRYFLSYAFFWCNNIRPEAAKTLVATNPHSLPRFRVNDVVSNMPEFAQAFGCRAGAKMMRTPACRVW